MIANQDNPAQVVKVKRKGKQGGSDIVKNLEGKGQGNRTLNRMFTRKQLAVLKVLMDPSSENRTDEDLMAVAGVCRSTFYQVKRDPEVQEEHRRLTQEMVANHITPILQASIETAKTPGRDGWQDRRWLTEYAGYYVPRKQVEQHVTGQLAVGVVAVSIDDV